MPSIAAIRKAEGEMPTLALLVKIIGTNIRFFNVGKTMNDLQLAETAKMIASEFYFLKPDDLIIFFNRLKSGFYGELFDRIDGQVIMLKLREYCEERTSTSETIRIEAHKVALAADKQESFLVMVDDEFIREGVVANQFEFVSKKEVATTFPYERAYIIRKKLSMMAQEGVRVKIVDVNKPEDSIMDYLKKHRPDLVPEEVKYKTSTEKYFDQKRQIMSREYSSELDRENDLRKLAGLDTITANEKQLHDEIYKGKNV